MRQLIINSGKRRFALFITLFLVVGLFSTFGASASGVAAKKADSAPAQPSGLKAEADNHSVMLTWNENTTDDDLLMYVLEYKRASEKWRNVPITDAAATTCRVGDLINYERYQFRLKVQDNNLNWSKYSDIVFATPADATLKDLRVDGETVADFSPDTLTYDAPLPFGTTVVPKVTASVNDRAATAVVTNTTGLPGSATVVVNAKATKDGRTQRTYTVHFTLPFTVSFVSNGGGHVEPIHVNSGQALGVLPVPNLPGSIFLGWYTDDNSFERAVSEDTQVTSDLTLYARYAAVAEVEEANKDLFVSAMDCEAGFAIDILSSDSAMSSDAVKAALQLEVLDNTPFAGLSVSGGVGAYSVTATEGYTPGSSYKLTLKNAALSFAGEPGSARTYCFTIHKPVVMNLRLDPGVTETPASEISDMTINGLQASGLSVPLASVGTDLSEIGDTGTFTYNGSEQLAVGDVMAIYMGTPLDQRDPTVDYSDQAVAYVEVIAIDGATVTYRTAEARDVLFTPDILPVDWADDVDGDPGNYAITIAVSDMTFPGEDFAEMGLDADTVVEKGDFLAFYDGSPPAEAEQVTFACINSVELSGS
ncbi:MAG: InlB B-repeat-containing protein, partial [Thermoleophilia bacterium]|nr:InlB B-repeat-containing protein [Thermoleophilia bacterium]